ncbi:MAG: SurA N-terminal domain-containing protein, partial [Burkholderiaceae bacterium]|nr:SurA N-terminal domain-containing protein [Burkholderiaceae bacterium]
MFDFVRKHTRLMQFVLFLLIFPSFVLFGLDGYNRYQEKGEAVARVDGRDIMQGEWDAAHKAEVDKVRASMPSLDPKLLDSPEARYATLERLVRDRVLAAAAEKLHLVTSDARLARDLQENPTIASLRRPDGTLDMERYRLLVGSQGLTPETFEAQVRLDLSMRRVLDGVAATGLTTSAQADVALNAYFERREIQAARFNTVDYAAKLSPTEAELEAFHKANPGLFQAPEQANIEYVTLDVDTLKKSVTVNEADIKTFYEQNAARLGGQEERRASHILIASTKASAEAERQKA